MSFRRVVLLGIGLLAIGCEKEASNAVPSSAESAAPKTKALDPDLAQAVAAASAGIGAGKAPGAGVEGGPPPNGIFAPGAADKEIQRGQRPKVTLGSEGSEPRVSLRPAQPKPGTRHDMSIRLSVQSGPNQGSLPIDFGLTFEAQKPKGEQGETDEIPVQAKVTSARIALSGAPRDLEASVAKLKGAKIEYLVLPDGGTTAHRTEVPKGAEESLADIVRWLSETIALLTLPVPDKPVGKGAYWMAATRDGMAGLDLVTYRLVKVEQVEAEKVTVNVNTKRYSATSTFDMPGLPPDVPRSLAEFQAIAESSLELTPGRGFPSGGRHDSALGATLGKADAPQQGGMLEIRTRAELNPEQKAR